MLVSVFFGILFNKEPYVSLLGGTFFIALEMADVLAKQGAGI